MPDQVRHDSRRVEDCRRWLPDQVRIDSRGSAARSLRSATVNANCASTLAVTITVSAARAGLRPTAASAVHAAPMPIWVQPYRPEAEPTSRGFTLTALASAAGLVMP